eukprot:2547125-Pyramimonas_sp.AAC.1
MATCSPQGWCQRFRQTDAEFEPAHWGSVGWPPVGPYPSPSPAEAPARLRYPASKASVAPLGE